MKKQEEVELEVEEEAIVMLSPPFEIPNGILNIGQICYCNSFIQLLTVIEEIPEKLQQLLNNPQSNTFKSVGSTLQQLLQQLNSKQSVTVDPRNFLGKFREKFPNFTPNQQHSAVEFFSKLITFLCDNENSDRREISSLFQFRQDKLSICQNCDFVFFFVCQFLIFSITEFIFKTKISIFCPKAI